MKSSITFRRADADGSLAYQYEDQTDPSITGKLECLETDLYSDLCRMIDLTRRYLDMAFAAATETPEFFDPASVQAIAEQLLDGQERRIKEVFNRVRERHGTLMIVENPRGNGHIEKNRIVDVYFKGGR